MNSLNRILPIGETGIYIDPNEFSQFVIDWMIKVSDFKKKEQLEKIGKILFVGALGVLLLSTFLKESKII